MYIFHFLSPLQGYWYGKRGKDTHLLLIQKIKTFKFHISK